MFNIEDRVFGERILLALLCSLGTYSSQTTLYLIALCIKSYSERLSRNNLEKVNHS